MNFPTIPPEEHLGIIRLAELNDEQVESLARTLSSAPVLISRDALLEKIPQVEGIPLPVQRSIVSALIYLNGYLATEEYDLPDFVRDVCSSIDVYGHKASELNAISSALLKLLSVESLQLRAKAVDLELDHARLFQSARILTDVRPVFGLEDASKVEGGLVSHTLKITYFEGEETKEFFVALDEYDLGQLEDALQRAFQKSKVLRGLMKDQLNIKDFSPESD